MLNLSTSHLTPVRRPWKDIVVSVSDSVLATDEIFVCITTYGRWGRIKLRTEYGVPVYEAELLHDAIAAAIRGEYVKSRISLRDVSGDRWRFTIATEPSAVGLKVDLPEDCCFSFRVKRGRKMHIACAIGSEGPQLRIGLADAINAVYDRRR